LWLLTRFSNWLNLQKLFGSRTRKNIFAVKRRERRAPISDPALWLAVMGSSRGGDRRSSFRFPLS
jgi:hypothetical protein